jgi:hypothetical protein
LSETERQQTPLRQKNKQYLTRNIQLSSKNHQLTVEAASKTMEHEIGDNESAAATKETCSNLKRSLTRPNVNQLGAITRLSKVISLCVPPFYFFFFTSDRFSHVYRNRVDIDLSIFEQTTKQL